MNLALCAALLLGSALLWMQLRLYGAETDTTWGCGYVAPTSRIQYTSSSFAQMVVALFAWALRPRIHKPQALPLFPQKSDFHSVVQDPVLDEAVLPTFRFSAWLSARFRVLQQGNIQLYLLYIFIALIALLLWR
jgi:hydrogenase-4 component B